MKKRVIVLGLAVVLICALTACSDPKSDAIDTNIQEQMENGTLDRS